MICEQCKYLRTFRLSSCKNIDMYECMKKKCILPKLHTECDNFVIKENINNSTWKFNKKFITDYDKL